MLLCLLFFADNKTKLEYVSVLFLFKTLFSVSKQLTYISKSLVIMWNIKNLSPVFFQELDCALVLLLLNQDLRLVKNNLRVFIVRVVVSASLSIGFILSLK